MSQNISFSELSSTSTRASVGARKFKASLQTATKDDDNNITGWLWNASSRVTGFIINNLGGITQFSATTIIGLFVSTSQFIWNFNWNATDDDLNRQIQAKFTALAGRFGGVLGQAFGYLACGVLPAAYIMTFNEGMGAYLMKEVGEELLEEILEELAGLARMVFRSTLEASLVWLYQNTRKLYKHGGRLLNKVLPGNQVSKIINAWGAKGSEPWSFAIAVENAVESIPNQALQEFVEEFLEEAWEGCVEAGYVIANGIDSYLFNQKLANKVVSPLGDTKYVELQFNRNNDDEKVILAGSEELVKTQLTQSMAVYQQVRARDIGVVYGTPPEAFPERRHKPELVLKFYQEKIDRQPGSKPVTMQISMRLMNKSIDDFATGDYALTLAKRIWSLFATPPFKHMKGAVPFSYADHEKGYQLLIYAQNSASARRVIEQVLDIQGHKIDSDKFKRASVRLDTLNAADPTPQKVTVLGERVTLPSVGNPGTVTFTNAYINLGVSVEPINLVDLKGKRKKVIYRGV